MQSDIQGQGNLGTYTSPPAGHIFKSATITREIIPSRAAQRLVASTKAVDEILEALRKLNVGGGYADVLTEIAPIITTTNNNNETEAPQIILTKEIPSPVGTVRQGRVETGETPPPQAGNEIKQLPKQLSHSAETEPLITESALKTREEGIPLTTDDVFTNLPPLASSEIFSSLPPSPVTPTEEVIVHEIENAVRKETLIDQSTLLMIDSIIRQLSKEETSAIKLLTRATPQKS